MARAHVLTSALLALLSAATSCAAPPPPPTDPRPPTIPIAAPAPEPLASAAPAPRATPGPARLPPSWEPKEPPAPPDLLAKLTPDQRTDLTLLAPLCPTGVREEGGKLLAGCTCCPNDCGPALDPSTRLLGSDALLLGPHSRVTGAFTEKDRTEHLVFMDTCACNGCPVHAYVLRPDGKGGYARAARYTVMSGDDCKVVHRKGQVDRALCSRFMARMGYAATTLNLYDFSKAPSADETPLTPNLEFTALNDLTLRCAPGATYVMRTITKWELRDVDRDGEDDLVVDLAVQDGKVTKDVLEICSHEEGLPPPKGDLPKTRYLTLTWTATPTGFSPDAKTAKLLAQLDAAKPKDD